MSARDENYVYPVVCGVEVIARKFAGGSVKVDTVSAARGTSQGRQDPADTGGGKVVRVGRVKALGGVVGDDVSRIGGYRYRGWQTDLLPATRCFTGKGGSAQRGVLELQRWAVCVPVFWDPL